MEGLLGRLYYLSFIHIFPLSSLWRKPTYKIRQIAGTRFIFFCQMQNKKIK